jgi:simple sugar transport system permease protein
MFDGILAAAAPLALAGVGALVSELAGFLAISTEGFMIFGGFFSWIFALLTGSVFLGCALAALLSALLGAVLARFVHKTRADPFVVGLALNLAAAGVTSSLSGLWFGTNGVLRNAEMTRNPEFALSLRLPFVYLALLCAVVTAVFIARTTAGLALRATGFSAEAAVEHGIDPWRYREGSWAAAAFFAALAGAALTWRIGAYVPGGTASRPWIALAAVYLGFRNVWGVCAASLIFAWTEVAAFNLQKLPFFPATAFLGFPSAVALVLYTSLKPYTRQPLSRIIRVK